jgi:small subunit ribosomal protein S10
MFLCRTLRPTFFSWHNVCANRRLSNGAAPQQTTSELPALQYPRCHLSFRSYDTAMLDAFANFSRSIASALDISVTGVIPIPTHIRRFTVLKSPHVHKKHRDQLEIRTHKRLLKLSNASHETLETYILYIKNHLPSEIGLKVSTFSYERLLTTRKEGA